MRKKKKNKENAAPVPETAPDNVHICYDDIGDSERVRSGAVLIILLTLLLLTAVGVLFFNLFKEKNGFVTETLEDGSIRSYYYLHGEKVTGWHVVGSYKRYFDENGVMVTGWQVIDGKKYYFNSKTGSLSVSITLTLDDGNKYVFDEYGVYLPEPLTGWQTAADGSTVYYDKNGRKVTGWKEIDGEKYYFQLRTGRMLVSETACIDGITYIFDENGSAISENQEILE